MSQKYYILRSNSDPEVIGVNNGIKQADILRGGFSNPAMFDNIMCYLGSNKYWEHPEKVNTLDFIVEHVKLIKHAISTDFLQFGPALINCPFMISDRAKNIFSKFKLCGCRLFPAFLHNGRDIQNYFLFYLPALQKNLIDFDRTSFFIGGPIIGKRQIKFANTEDYTAYKRENINLKIDSLYFSSAFDRTLDVFRIGGEIIITDKLHAELIESKMTGLNLLPAFGEISNWMTIHGE